MSAKPSTDIFHDRLRTARLQLRAMSQVDLAKATGLPPTSITHFERGARKPSIDTLRKLADALDVTTDYLLGRADTPDAEHTVDPAYRHDLRLSARDRALAEAFLHMLAEHAQLENDNPG